MKNIDRDIIKVWRIRDGIKLAVAIFIAILGMILGNLFEVMELKIAGFVIAGLITLYAVLNIAVFSQIRYRRWAYSISEDRVIIQNGLFFISKTVVPIVRIQHISVENGPVMNKYDLKNVAIHLASGEFSIIGLKTEIAEELSEYLKNKLYVRMEARKEI